MSNSLLERLYYNLPKNFRNADVKERYQLKRYLDILVSGGIVPLHEETKALLTLIDIDKIPAKFLPHLASDLGFAFPYDLDEATQRTYIKNAVISYRMKGTKKALLFMIRELTKFTVTLDVNEDERTLAVKLEVDPDRQDLEKMYAKVKFLVEEYAPPFGEIRLTNSFMWDEIMDSAIRNRMYDELLETFMVSYSAYEPINFLILNHDRGAILNSHEYNISSFDQYARHEVRYEYDTYVQQAKEDNLWTPKDDTFGEGTHTTVYPPMLESVFFKVWDKETTIAYIKDGGVSSVLSDHTIVLNRMDYGLNSTNILLTNVEVLDFNEENYPSRNTLGLVYDMDLLSYIKAVDEESHQVTTDMELVAITKAVDEAELKRVIQESNSTSKVQIITSLSRDFNFVLVQSATGDPDQQLLGQIEQLARRSMMEDSINYDIIETGKIGSKYNETKSLRSEEYGGADKMTDDFTDKITYVEKE